MSTLDDYLFQVGKAASQCNCVGRPDIRNNQQRPNNPLCFTHRFDPRVFVASSLFSIMVRKEAIVAAALRADSLKAIKKHNACNVRPLPRSRQADCVR